MRAGDDQHGDGARERLVGLTEEKPHAGRDRCGTECDVEQERSSAVGDGLGPRLGFLRFGHQALDAAEGRIFADGRDFDANRVVGGDRACDHVVAGGLRHRVGLTCQHRLIDLSGPVEDLAVRGDSSAGTHQQAVADGEIRDRDGGDVVVLVDPLGVVGKELGESSEGALGLADGLHLLPMAEEHDHDEACQFPPELEVERIGERQQRSTERHRDRQCDQQHHPGLALPGFVIATGQERAPAVDIDGRAEGGSDPARACEREVVVQPFLDLAREGEYRDGKGEVRPEQSPEHLGVVGMAAVSRVFVVPGW